MTLSQMEEGKSSRIDGLPSKVYKSCWEFVSLDFHKLYLESLILGCLGYLINKGNIKIISKIRYPYIITTLRPITLLYVSYNIIEKSLGLRIRPLLPLII